MAIPTVTQIADVLLQALGDGKGRSMEELVETVCDHLSLTVEERTRKMPKGVLYVYDRTHWARTRLKGLGLLAQPERGGPVSITDEGKRKLAGRRGLEEGRSRSIQPSTIPHGNGRLRKARSASATGRPTSGTSGAVITAAVAVWIAAATLHRKYGNDRTFTARQICDMVERQGVCCVTRGTIQSHISKYCVANKPAGAEKHRKLYNVSGRRGVYRLYRAGDDEYHKDREDGPEEPDPVDLPSTYGDLLKWYKDVYCKKGQARGGRDLAVVLDPSIIIPWIKEDSALEGSAREWLDENSDNIVITAKTVNELHLESGSRWSGPQQQRIRRLAGFRIKVRGNSRQKVDALQKSLRDATASKEAGEWIKRKRRDLFRNDEDLLKEMGLVNADKVHPGKMSDAEKTACLHRLFDRATQDRNLISECIKLAEDKLVVLLARDTDFVAFPTPSPTSPHPEKNCILIIAYGNSIVVGHAADGALAVSNGLADADGAFGEEDIRRLYEIESALT